jgi:cytochrome P450
MQLFDDLEDFGTFDDAVSGDVRDPYTDLARMRREEPVQRLDMSAMPHEESKPVFMVYRYEDVAQVFRDNETFSSAIILDFFGDALGKHVMLGMDEPEHRRHRALVSAAFSQKALARRQDDLVERVASELIDRFADRGRADLGREFTFPYPTQIIAGLLGLPREDYPQFQRWSISLLSIPRQPGARPRRPQRCVSTSSRSSRPGERSLATTSSAASHRPRSTAEARTRRSSRSCACCSRSASRPRTARGNPLFGLSRTRPADAVCSDRSLIPQAIEEAVRWEPPLLVFTRVATRDAELAGVPIPAGSSVMPMLGSANRDEERWADPDRFDIFRPAKPHIGFGYGVHVCLGMHLARLEMRVALNVLLDRRQPAFRSRRRRSTHPGQVFRSPTSLPVLFETPAA